MRTGFMLNPDDAFVKGCKKRIKQNNGYCPNKRDKVPDNKCPCREFRENSECDCGMYIKDPTYIIDEKLDVEGESPMEGYV